MENKLYIMQKKKKKKKETKIKSSRMNIRWWVMCYIECSVSVMFELISILSLQFQFFTGSLHIMESSQR